MYGTRSLFEDLWIQLVLEESNPDALQQHLSIPEINYDPFLILIPHVFLLGVKFADCTFAVPNVTDPERLSRLDIPLGCNEHRLPLDLTMDDVPLFLDRSGHCNGGGCHAIKYCPIRRWLLG